MKRYTILLLLFATFSISSCTAEDEPDIPKQTTPVSEQDIGENGNYHILIIGNSLSRDAFSYTPPIMIDLCPNITLDINIYYKGGVGLSSHWNSVKQRLADHVLDTYLQSENKWTSTYAVIGAELISSKEWDLIVLQEGNVTCRQYEPTSENVNTFSSYIHSILPDTKIAYMMVPAQPEGSSVLGEYTSDEVWQMFANTAQNLIENHDVEYIIPCGTAIQNARHTRLDDMGDYGHLSYDGVHIQEGLPCFIDAYTATQSLLMILGIDTDITKSELFVNRSWFYYREIPGRHGEPILGEEIDYKLCQHCAMEAIYDPFNLME